MTLHPQGVRVPHAGRVGTHSWTLMIGTLFTARLLDGVFSRRFEISESPFWILFVKGRTPHGLWVLLSRFPGDFFGSGF